MLALLPALVVEGNYMELNNITAAVFGTTLENRSFIPAAFGDFNSDKLTDMVVLKHDKKMVAVLLATEILFYFGTIYIDTKLLGKFGIFLSNFRSYFH